jgi:hypothetical protein
VACKDQAMRRVLQVRATGRSPSRPSRSRTGLGAEVPGRDRRRTGSARSAGAHPRATQGARRQRVRVRWSRWRVPGLLPLGLGVADPAPTERRPRGRRRVACMRQVARPAGFGPATFGSGETRNGNAGGHLKPPAVCFQGVAATTQPATAPSRRGLSVICQLTKRCAQLAF